MLPYKLLKIKTSMIRNHFEDDRLEDTDFVDYLGAIKIKIRMSIQTGSIDTHQYNVHFAILIFALVIL